ncbi:MAG: hypothetical protein QM765_45160 [Myxococcales bacterium]
MTSRSAVQLAGLLALLPVTAYAGGSEEPAPASRAGLSAVAWSPEGSRIAMSEDGLGLHVFDRATGEMVSLSEDRGAGYRVRWSPDGSKIAFKLFAPVDGAEYPLQVPVLYDFTTGSYRRLSAPVERAGVPAFAGDGSVAFTVGEAAVVLDANLSPVRRLPLGEYINLVSLSPDGSSPGLGRRSRAVDCRGGDGEEGARLRPRLALRPAVERRRDAPAPQRSVGRAPRVRSRRRPCARAASSGERALDARRRDRALRIEPRPRR